MDFGWLKRLFKKKNLSNVNTSDIATIDTSFIDVPKLEEFSKEEQKEILKYTKTLNLDNYEPLLKFSDDLATKYDYEQDLLQQKMNRYDLLYDEIIPDTDISLIQRINLDILSEYEYSITIENMDNIRKELYLRLTALDMFIKKEEKRKYDFLGIYGKAERLKYFAHKNRLLSERERIKILIKQNYLICLSTKHTITENSKLKGKHDTLKQIQEKIENNNGTTDLIREELVNSIEKIKDRQLDPVDLWIPFAKEVINCIINRLVKRYKMIHEKSDITWLEDVKTNLKKGEILEILIKHLPDDLLKEFYKIVAKYLHEYEIYIYEHKNDYKDYLKEINDVINSYQKAPTIEWDMEELIKSIHYYDNLVDNYINVFYDYIPVDERALLRNLVIKLKWFRSLLIPSSKIDSNFGSITPKMNPSFFTLTDELIKQIEEEYDVSISKINPLFSKKIEKYREEFIEKNYDHCIYLFDLLNKRECNDNVYQQRLDYDSSRSISLEDYCYMMLLLDNNLILNYFVKPDDEYKLSTSYDEWYEFVTNVRYEQIKRYHDKRIIIVPKKVWIGKLNFDTHDLSSIDNYQNIKAIYTEPHCGLSTFLEAMKYSADIYIISKEKEMDNQYSKWEYDNPIGDWRSATYLYKDYDGIYMNLDYKDDYIHVYTYHAEKGAIGKLIIVPDNTEYSDLSFYLDQVLEMEKEQLKVLNKTL